MNKATTTKKLKAPKLSQDQAREVTDKLLASMTVQLRDMRGLVDAAWTSGVALWTKEQYNELYDGIVCAGDAISGVALNGGWLNELADANGRQALQGFIDRASRATK